MSAHFVGVRAQNGRWAVPSDRVPETHSSSAHTLLAVELMLVLAICAGVTMHHRKAYWISESLVLTLGGIVLGLFVSAFGSDQVVDALEFDEVRPCPVSSEASIFSVRP